MKIILSPDFKERNIDISLGVIQADVCVEPSSKNLLSLLEQTANLRLEELDGKPASSVEQISHTRKAYKALGKDPARYRPAAEALTRRLIQGKGLYHVNNVVDVNNLVSIKSGISIGTYIADEIKGDVVFRRANAGESYKGIGRGDLNLEGLPVFSDEIGPFGCPTSDSERTMIKEGKQQILMVLINFGSSESLQEFLDQSVELLKEHCSAEVINLNILK